MKIKLALIQFSPSSYKVKANVKRALYLCKKAVKKGARLVVLPELFDSGYCVEDRDLDFAIDLSLENFTIKSLQEFARKHKVHIIASSIQKENNLLYDFAYIISGEGILGTYKKTHLWADEKKRFKKGDEYPVFDLDIDGVRLRIGIGICYEIGFSEIARIMALKGAQILIYPSAFGKARLYAWNLASRARALENGVFVLACNRSGKEFSKLSNTNLYFAASSRIINPKGELIKSIDEKEGFCVAKIDLDEVFLQQKELPYLKDLNLALIKDNFNSF